MARALPQEVEIKLPVNNLAGLRRRLQSIGAQAPTRLRGRVFEHNVLFDLFGHPLRKRGALLRLRWQMPAPSATIPPPWEQPAGGATLTYKGRASAHGGYKVADELEMAVDDPQCLTAILAAMGFRPSFRYEKFRTEFRVQKIPGLAVDLDETPIGNFVELEGTRVAIDKAAALLGYGRRDYVTGSYASLYRQFCLRHGRPFGDMLFHRRKK